MNGLALAAPAAPAPLTPRRLLRRPRRLVIELGRGRMQVVATRDTDEPVELEHQAALVAAEKSTQ